MALSAGTRDRVRRAMPENTRRAYTGDLRRFLSWCAEKELLPAEADTTDDERPADTLRQLLERHGDLAWSSPSTSARSPTPTEQ